MTGFYRAWRNRNPGAPLWRLLLWSLVRHVTFLFIFIFYRVRVYNAHRIPAAGPVLLLCNHQSYVDLMILGTALHHRHFHSMARKSLFRNPIFGAYIRGLNAFEVDQQKKGDVRAIRTAIERLNAGQLVLIFPEGARTKDGAVHDLQEGTMLLLRRAKPVVVPAALEGVYDAWPIWRKWPTSKARIAITFGEPIPAEKLLAMGPKETLPHIARRIDELRLDLRRHIRLLSDGRYPRPGVGDRPSFSQSPCDLSHTALVQPSEEKVTPKPVPLGLAPSFGFGDRTGLATPGHVEAMKRAGVSAGIQPIFPQQSIREMSRTGRSPKQVMDEALSGMARAGWTGVTGADADHLKTRQDVDRTAAVGFTFFTIDPSGHVDVHADDFNENRLREKFAAIRGRIDWFEKYLGKTVTLPNGTVIELDERACVRCAVKYGEAIREAVDLAGYIREVQEKAGRGYEIELSVDETPQPTTLAEHYIIADQCLSRGMKLVSLAPRFIGELEKGVDYKGDLVALERSLHDHAAIARLLGPYKLSLHSGSDKLSMYGLFARATRGRFHVKTAGTSYLEALRVAARHDEKLFRRIVSFARERYDTDKATYHVSATLADAPPPEAISSAAELERLYLENWSDVPAGRGFTAPGRQVLHCTFGSVLTDATLGVELRGVLHAHPETYTEVLAVHFARHLSALA